MRSYLIMILICLGDISFFASSYRKVSPPESCLLYRQACKVYREQHNETGFCYAYLGTAITHYLQNHLDSYLSYRQKTLSVAEKYDGNRWRYVLLLSALPHINEKKKDFLKFLNNKIELLSLGGLCVLVILVALLKDRLNKNKIIKLQKQLDVLRAGILQNTSLDEDVSIALEPINSEKEDFEACFKMKMNLCLKLYRKSDAYRKIHMIENEGLRHKFHLNAAERQNICETLYENFSDLMTDLKLQCPSLTKQDLLHCMFLMMNCPKYVILLCTGISEGAFKTRKSRIKEKLGDRLFKLLTHKEC